ncbi:hypothetical protein LT330_000946 [Penicillium expansum]|nr:hypothetical protein LT330_000946 [Penicillium expansum]
MPLPSRSSKWERLSAKLHWHSPRSLSATPNSEKNRLSKGTNVQDGEIATRVNSSGPRRGVSPASQRTLQPEDLCHELPMTELLTLTSSSSKDLWQRASQQLPDDARQRLTVLGFTEQTQTTNEHRVKDLIGVVQEKEDMCKQKKWKVTFARHEIIIGDYAVKAATWLQKIGDIVIPFAPPQASPPWGLVKAILQIPINANEQMFAVLATTEKVVQVIFHCQVYESVYHRDQLPEDMLQALHDALIAVYKTLLELLLHTKDLLSQSTFKQFMRSIVSPSDGLFSSVSSQEAKLRETVQSCEIRRSADVDGTLLRELHAIQAPVARIDFRIEACFQKMDKRDSLALLEWISNEPYTTYHESVKERRTDNIGEWLLRHQDFREWEDSSSSAVLWLRGLAGVGKTCLASKVIDHVKDTLSQGKNHEGFAFYYCSRNDGRRRDPLSVLSSFVRQLSTTSNDPYNIQKSLRETCESRQLVGAKLDIASCKRILLESLNLFPKTTMVLDALDECDSATRGVLITFLDGLLSAAKNPVKVFVVSRPDEDIRNQFLTRPNIEIQANDNHADIELYLNARILELAQSNKALLAWKNQITARLLEHCDGMFQWVYLHLEQLRNCKTEEAVSGRLNHVQKLPKGLRSTYDDIFQEIQDLEESDYHLVRRAMMWVTCADTPLSSEELLCAIRMIPQQNGLHLSSCISEDSLLSLCRNLLVIDSQTNKWRPSHASVVDYLESFHWKIIDAHIYAATTCVAFLLEPLDRQKETPGSDEMPNTLQCSDQIEIDVHPFGNDADLDFLTTPLAEAAWYGRPEVFKCLTLDVTPDLK